MYLFSLILKFQTSLYCGLLANSRYTGLFLHWSHFLVADTVSVSKPRFSTGPELPRGTTRDNPACDILQNTCQIIHIFFKFKHLFEVLFYSSLFLHSWALCSSPRLCSIIIILLTKWFFALLFTNSL